MRVGNRGPYCGVPRTITINDHELRRDAVVRIDQGAVIYWWHNDSGNINLCYRLDQNPAGGEPVRSICLFSPRSVPPVQAGVALTEVFLPDQPTMGEYMPYAQGCAPALVVTTLGGVPSLSPSKN